MQKLFLFLWGLCLPLWPTVAQNRSAAKPVTSSTNTAKGVALVVGNWKYPDNPLKNPENDAKDMAELFRQLGYEVIYKENLSKVGMEDAHSEFIGRLAKSRVGIFYFAGHGFRGNDNTNYLNSIELRSAHTEALSRDKSLSMDIVMQDMKNTNPEGTNILFIDACRTFQGRGWGRNGNNQGLGKVNAPRGTLAFFAASVGQEASENTGQRNGLFTQELKKQLTQPNLELTEVLRNTAKAVYDQNRSQEPYWEGNFYEKFYFMNNQLTVIESNKGKNAESNEQEGKKDFDEALDFFYGKNQSSVNYKKALEYLVKAESKGYTLKELSIDEAQQKYCSTFKKFEFSKDDFMLFGMDMITSAKVRVVSGDFWLSDELPTAGFHYVGPQSGIINGKTKIFEANSAVVLTGRPSSFIIVYETKFCDVDGNNECIKNKDVFQYNSCHYYKMK